MYMVIRWTIRYHSPVQYNYTLLYTYGQLLRYNLFFEPLVHFFRSWSGLSCQSLSRVVVLGSGLYLCGLLVVLTRILAKIWISVWCSIKWQRSVSKVHRRQKWLRINFCNAFITRNFMCWPNRNIARSFPCKDIHRKGRTMFRSILARILGRVTAGRPRRCKLLPRAIALYRDCFLVTSGHLGNALIPRWSRY